MDNEDRKILTEFLGECWFAKPSNHFEACCCGDCLDYRQCNRTFDTWEDFGALLETIAKKTEVDAFELWLWKQGYSISNIDTHNGPLSVLKAIKEGVL